MPVTLYSGGAAVVDVLMSLYPSQNSTGLPSLRRTTVNCPACIITWLPFMTNKLPSVETYCAMGPVTGLSRSASEIFARAARLASRTLLKSETYSVLLEKPLGGSIAAVVLPCWSLHPAVSLGYTDSGICDIVNLRSESMRWPSCQAM